ncbi:MAG: carboxypeptidase-like regulatory domain-containing protein, partial [Candidatus Paceibacterota bacterium]
MKHKLPLLLIVLISVALPISSQIKGTVNDNIGNPIEYVNVALYSLPDTTLIGGSVTDSLGNFTITSNEIENTFLQISMLGYETRRVKTQAFQNIVLQPSSEYLDEVVIEGERPALKVDQGKLIYHVPSLLKNKPVTNAYDALKEIPGVVEQGENLMLIGTSGMTVLLNGQKTSMSYEQLMNLLRSIPLSRVEDVEIMHSAPPQYNIRGAAINVVLKQTADEETENIWQGEIAGEYQQRTHASGNGRVSLLYLGKNITFDALYSDRYTEIENREDKTNDHTVNNQLYYIKEKNKGINKNNSHNVRTALGITLTNKDKIEVAYTGMFDNPKGHRMADIAIDENKIDSD